MRNKIFGLILLTIGTCFSMQAEEPILFTKHAVKTNDLTIYSSQTSTPLSEKENDLIQYVKLSVDNASKRISRLTPEVLAIDGMSSPKVRHFLNNICSYPGASYLEVGCWKGSTFIAALYNNERFIHSAFGIDNWSEFGSPMGEFQSNCTKFLDNVPFGFFPENCFTLKLASIPMPVNIFMYDGSHTTENLYQAIAHFNPIFDDAFIIIIDDWNWDAARAGVFKAFRDLKYTVVYEISLPALENGDINNWWNGYYIAVIRKK